MRGMDHQGDKALAIGKQEVGSAKMLYIPEQQILWRCGGGKFDEGRIAVGLKAFDDFAAHRFKILPDSFAIRGLGKNGARVALSREKELMIGRDSPGCGEAKAEQMLA